MTPEAQRPTGDSPTGAAPSAFLNSASPRSDSQAPIQIIAKRRDFLAASRARKWVAPSMIVQGRKRREGEPHDPAARRVGYTCSKKVGNAVARNRAKRRLRAAVAAALPHHGRPGWDYVLIGRNEATAARPFADLVADLEKALSRLHEPPKPRKPK